jgi:hypothetical protein
MANFTAVVDSDLSAVYPAVSATVIRPIRSAFVTAVGDPHRTAIKPTDFSADDSA